MAEKKPAIAIVGGGIVGATAAYYLAREDYSVTLFDSGEGQATTAAAGIICPWFTKRRNKEWYYLVSNGAEFYRQFMQKLADDGFPTDEIFEEFKRTLQPLQEKGEIYCSALEPMQGVTIFRSPHICAGNVIVATNKVHKEFTEW